MDIDYWESFYSDGGPQRGPSDFAHFIGKRFPQKGHVFEFGCGDGTDSLFFAENGWNVAASDASIEAVSLARTRSKSCIGEADPPRFEVCDVAGGDLPMFFQTHNPDHAIGQISLVFTRFFLHSLDENEFESFVRSLAQSVNSRIHMAHEFRVPEDAGLKKMFGNHNRVYRTPDNVVSMFQCFFEVSDLWVDEGTGRATYGGEDAAVGRTVFLAAPKGA